MEGTSNSEPVAETTDSSRGRKLRKLADYLECCICRNHLRDAHICGQCSQPFCRACIDQWLTTKPSCPHCRQTMTEQTVVKARTFDQLGAIVNELRDDEQQNRCRSHRREQLFYCFVCKESICDRCTYEKVHLEHKDEVVLLDVAFDHYNKRMSEDLQWIKDQADNLKKHEDRMQQDKHLLETVSEHVKAIMRHTSASISKQYERKLNKHKQSQELFLKRSSPFIALYQKSRRFASQEKTASTLEQLIKFKKEVKLLRSETSPIDKSVKLVDLSYVNNVLPNPVQITFRLRRTESYGSTATDTNGSVWKMQWFRNNNCVTSSLLLEQGPPGGYWIACRDNPAKLYVFEPKKYVQLSIEKLRNVYEYHRSDQSFEMVITIFQDRAYTEQYQQDYIKRLETKIAGYEKRLADIREKTGSLQSEDQSDSDSDSSIAV